MSTTITNAGLIELGQEALIDLKLINYFRAFDFCIFNRNNS